VEQYYWPAPVLFFDVLGVLCLRLLKNVLVLVGIPALGNVVVVGAFIFWLLPFFVLRRPQSLRNIGVKNMKKFHSINPKFFSVRIFLGMGFFEKGGPPKFFFFFLPRHFRSNYNVEKTYAVLVGAPGCDKEK